MNLPRNPFLPPGIAIKTGNGDHYPIEQMLLAALVERGLELLRRHLVAARLVVPEPADGAGARAECGIRIVDPEHVCAAYARGAGARRPPGPEHSDPISPRMRDLVSDLVHTPLDDLMAEARGARARATHVTYSPKVFIPLTTLCRDVCGYCTFARPPRRGERAFMTEDEVLAIARAGAAAGCTEALFTLGDKPELRYKVARRGARCTRLRDDARVPRPLREARARGDRPSPAPQPGRHEPR